MLLFYLCKDQNVVQVHYNNPFCYDSSEDIVHYSLEGSRAVGHSKKYYERFKEATVGAEGYFPLISRLDALMGIKRFDHKTKVKARSERRNLQTASQLCTKQVGTGEINQIIESLLKVKVQRITKTY